MSLVLDITQSLRESFIFRRRVSFTWGEDCQELVHHRYGDTGVVLLNEVRDLGAFSGCGARCFLQSSIGGLLSWESLLSWITTFKCASKMQRPTPVAWNAQRTEPMVRRDPALILIPIVLLFRLYEYCSSFAELRQLFLDCGSHGRIRRRSRSMSLMSRRHLTTLGFCSPRAGSRR